MVSYRKPKPVEQKKPQTTTAQVDMVSECTRIFSEYINGTEKQLLAIDAYLASVMLIGITIFVYCVLFMPRPFNIFIAAFVACVGSFVLGGKFLCNTVSLRMQVDPKASETFPEVGPRKALFDFVLANIVLHAIVINYIG